MGLFSWYMNKIRTELLIKTYDLKISKGFQIWILETCASSTHRLRYQYLTLNPEENNLNGRYQFHSNSLTARWGAHLYFNCLLWIGNIPTCKKFNTENINSNKNHNYIPVRWGYIIGRGENILVTFAFLQNLTSIFQTQLLSFIYVLSSSVFWFSLHEH